MRNQPILVIHGGAWAIPDEVVASHLEGLEQSLAAGWAALSKGGSALDAIEEAVAAMEEHEAFDAGRGSFLNSDGKVQLDALMMDGATLRAGGVGCVERLRNPVRAARRILHDSAHVYFVGEGAERFAEEKGATLCDNAELIIPREVERLREYKEKLAQGGGTDNDLFAAIPSEEHPDPVPGEPGSTLGHDTVGAVALDAEGNIAAATSTGGILNKTPGRVGDSSLIGCGCYADNESAAVSTTGWGEPMMKLVLAKWTADYVAAGHAPEAAAAEAIAMLKRRLGGHGGLIVLDRAGRWGIHHNTPRMAWGVRTEAGAQRGIER